MEGFIHGRTERSYGWGGVTPGRSLHGEEYTWRRVTHGEGFHIEGDIPSIAVAFSDRRNTRRGVTHEGVTYGEEICMKRSYAREESYTERSYA